MSQYSLSCILCFLWSSKKNKYSGLSISDCTAVGWWRIYVWCWYVWPARSQLKPVWEAATQSVWTNGFWSYNAGLWPVSEPASLLLQLFLLWGSCTWRGMLSFSWGIVSFLSIFSMLSFLHYTLDTCTWWKQLSCFTQIWASAISVLMAVLQVNLDPFWFSSYTSSRREFFNGGTWFFLGCMPFLPPNQQCQRFEPGPINETLD